MAIKQLLEEHGALVQAARRINELAAKDGTLSVHDQKQFDALMHQAAAKMAAVREMEAADDIIPFESRETLTGAFAGTMATGKDNKSGAKLHDAQGRAFSLVQKGESFAEAVSQTPRVAADKHTAALINDGLTLGGMIRASFTGAQTSAERAALSGADGSGGGYTVPSKLSANLIDRFRARMRMMEFGAQTIPLDSDSHTFVKITGDPSVSWRREGVTISESQPSFGAITFQPRSVAVIVKCTLELMQDSLNINQAIERTLAEKFAAEVDRVGMFGNGDSEPTGLVNETGINEVAAVGTPSDYAKLLDAYKLILDDNAPDPTGVIMSNREWRTFAGLEDTTGQPLMRPKAIENLPFGATSAVPTNQGSGSDSTMLMGYFPDFMFGVRAELQIEMLRELYRETGHYAFVAMLRIDTAAFHPESFCKLTGVTSA